MVGGAIGVVLTGVFASLAVNAVGATGGWLQLGRQSVLAGAALVYPFVVTWLILVVTDKTVGLRVRTKPRLASTSACMTRQGTSDSDVRPWASDAAGTIVSVLSAIE